MEPCDLTRLIEVSLGPYIVDVNVGSITFPIDPIQDSVSVNFGDGSGIDLCGPRSYTLLEDLGNADLIVPSFAFLNPSDLPSLTVTPTEDDIGPHNMILEVTL